MASAKILTVDRLGFKVEVNLDFKFRFSISNFDLPLRFAFKMYRRPILGKFRSVKIEECRDRRFLLAISAAILGFKSLGLFGSNKVGWGYFNTKINTAPNLKVL